MDNKPKSILLRDVPLEVYQHLIKIQAEKKQKHNKGQFSLEMTVYSIIREHKKENE